jgi:hypothetical protein
MGRVLRLGGAPDWLLWTGKPGTSLRSTNGQIGGRTGNRGVLMTSKIVALGGAALAVLMVSSLSVPADARRGGGGGHAFGGGGGAFAGGGGGPMFSGGGRSFGGGGPMFGGAGRSFGGGGPAFRGGGRSFGGGGPAFRGGARSFDGGRMGSVRMGGPP